jgi:hypothetical protein
LLLSFPHHQQFRAASSTPQPTQKLHCNHNLQQLDGQWAYICNNYVRFDKENPEMKLLV